MSENLWTYLKTIIESFIFEQEIGHLEHDLWNVLQKL